MLGAEEDFLALDCLLVPVGLICFRWLDLLPFSNRVLGATLSGSATTSNGLSGLSDDFLEGIQLGLERNEGLLILVTSFEV
jgi:hypothetical protein